jgi:hypothetical protein
MDVLLATLSVCDYKTCSKRKNIPTLGLEPMYFVTKEHFRRALTRSANSGCDEKLPFYNIHP